MTELEYIAKLIDEKAEQIRDDTVMGGAEDFAAYKYGCGIYRGLLLAKGYIADVAKKIEEDDD